MQYDIRNFKCGGWQMSQVTVKVNGRWSYIYPGNSAKPTNRKEPIGLQAGYDPPNHKHEKFELYTLPKDHPLKMKVMEQRISLPRPPCSRMGIFLQNEEARKMKKKRKGRQIVTQQNAATFSSTNNNNNDAKSDMFLTAVDNTKSEDLNRVMSRSAPVSENAERDMANTGKQRLISSAFLPPGKVKVPYWKYYPETIPDLRAKTALYARINKRNQIWKEGILREQMKDYKTPPSDFTSIDLMQVDDSILNQTKRQTKTVQAIRENQRLQNENARKMELAKTYSFNKRKRSLNSSSQVKTEDDDPILNYTVVHVDFSPENEEDAIDENEEME